MTLMARRQTPPVGALRAIVVLGHDLDLAFESIHVDAAK
jgi:hypothetical protein